jgi:hypothetical protein
VEDLLVLSLGTGQLLEVNYDYDQVTRWKAKDWARPMARISSDASADLVDQAVAMAFGHCRSTNYVRVQVCLSMNVVKIQFTMLMFLFNCLMHFITRVLAQ